MSISNATRTHHTTPSQAPIKFRCCSAHPHIAIAFMFNIMKWYTRFLFPKCHMKKKKLTLSGMEADEIQYYIPPLFVLLIL